MSAPALGDQRGLDRTAWLVLAIVSIFWIADGYDTFILLVTGRPALVSLLGPQQAQMLPRYLGYLIAITLAGWASGGIAGGLLGDRLGRRRTMLIGVVIYSVATALSGLASSFWMFALLRFVTGVGIGSEWGVGTSLLQEVWPERWRTRGAGIMQSGFAVGGVAVSGLWAAAGSAGVSWRWMYAFGVAPLVVIAAIYRAIPESDRWARRGKVAVGRMLLGSPALRRNLAASLVVSVSITGGWWAATSFLPSYVASLVADPRAAAYYAGWAGVLYNLGEVAGCVALGFLAEAIGRRPTTILYLLGSLVIVPCVFLGVVPVATVTLLQLVAGFLTGGLYSWYTVHTPELFPTQVRATAISIVFSGARYLAMLGAISTGVLVSTFGGIEKIATCFAALYCLGIVGICFLPETRGQGLPD